MLQQPLPRKLQALANQHVRSPPQHSIDLGDPRIVLADIALAWCDVFDADAPTGHLPDKFGQFQDTGLHAGRDLEDFAAHVAFERQSDRVAQIADIDKVARLLPIAVDCDPAIGQNIFEELRDHAAFVGRIRPIEIGEAQHNRAQTPRAVVGQAVALAGELAGAIG